MLGIGTALHGCGCSVSQLAGGGGIVSVAVCSDHRDFGAVQRMLRLATSALEEAHEKLPIRPEPPRAA